MEEHRLHVDGTWTQLLEAGQGPPILLLHGGIQCGGVYWSRVVSRFVGSHRVLAPDVPGLGESEPLSRLGATEFAHWFEALLRLTCTEPPTLVAHSLNSSLAARFAASQAHLQGRLVLTGAPGIGPYRPPPGLLLAATRSSLRPTEANLERFLPWPFLDADRTRRLDPEWFAAFSAFLRSRSEVPSVRRTMHQLIRAGTKQVPDKGAREHHHPHVSAVGPHDRMAPLRLAEAAQERFGWPLHIIENAGHVPFVEQTDAYVDSLAECPAGAVTRLGRGQEPPKPEAPMSIDENKALLRRAWDEIYGDGRLDSLEQFVQDDVVAHEPDGDVRGLEEFKWYLTTFLAAFPDTSATIEDVVAEGDKVVSRYTVRGTHTGATEEYGPPTGRQVVMEGITLYHFKDGKLAEMWDRYDNLAVMQQLGLTSEAEPPSPS